MNVIVGCEFSGVVRDAFIQAGHEAMSCDLMPTESPGPHHHGCVVNYLFRKPDNYFDLGVFHPDCTEMCVSGNGTYAKGKPGFNKRVEAVMWTQELWLLAIRKCRSVCFENPVGVLATMSFLPKPQYVQPYHFGHPETKKTGLFLRNIKPLRRTEDLSSIISLIPDRIKSRIHRMPPGEDRGKERSVTYPGIAKAMANQWGA